MLHGQHPDLHGDPHRTPLHHPGGPSHTVPAQALSQAREVQV